jgi:two-component system sensor histidine kinase MprB
MTLRARIALAMAVLTGATAIFVAATTYVATDQRVRSEVDQSLASTARRFQDPDGRLAANICGTSSATRPRTRPPEMNDEFSEGLLIQCLDSNGDFLASTGSIRLPVNERDQRIASSGRGSQTRTVRVGDSTFRVETVGVQPGGAVQIARDYGETNRVLASLRMSLIAIVLSAAAVSALVGWLIARKATKPLVQLTDAAEEVANTGRLDVDVPPAGNDEPGRLARAFSTMLVALGQSRDQQQQLVQDAGHELRTPLTSLRTNVETLQRYPDLPEETRRTILDDLESETRELGSLVDELVQLATDTFDDEPEELVALDQLASRIVERVRRRTGREITLVTVPTTVVGRPRDLARAIGNLVDNAAKFSEAPSAVDVIVTAGSVSVRDRGPGVAPEDQAHVFDRFFRSPQARSKPGSGLGLAIVDQTAKSHGGTVSVGNHPEGGAVFVFSIPEAPQPPESSS